MKSNDNMNCRMKFLYSNMRLLRRVNGISQETISYDLHLRRSTYSDYESGRKIPDLQTIRARFLTGDVTPSAEVSRIGISFCHNILVSMCMLSLSVMSEIMSSMSEII